MLFEFRELDIGKGTTTLRTENNEHTHRITDFYEHLISLEDRVCANDGYYSTTAFWCRCTGGRLGGVSNRLFA